MTTTNISVPKSETRIAVDVSAFPALVATRLTEIGLNAVIRSGVNNKLALEVEKAFKASIQPTIDAFNAAEKAKLEANAKYKVKAFKVDPKAEKAFAETFNSTLDPVKLAQERIDALMAGTLPTARGKSNSDKALMSLVKANILAVLKSKGKKHRDAVNMIGDDPMVFIEKTAAKRGGDDAEAVKAELAKLTAQYVTPAREMLAEEPDSDDDAEGETQGTDADDLV